MAFTSDNLQELIHLLEEQPQARRQIRSLLINGDFQAVPDRLDRLFLAVIVYGRAMAVLPLF